VATGVAGAPPHSAPSDNREIIIGLHFSHQEVEVDRVKRATARTEGLRAARGILIALPIALVAWAIVALAVCLPLLAR
jgi:hypothetical protein